MSEEMNKPQEIVTGEVKVEEVKAEEVKAEEVKTEEIKPEEIRKEEVRKEEVRKSTPIDLSNVKIRHVLGQRIKKCGAKKIISYVLVAVIFFCAGLMTDRFVMRDRFGRGFNGKPGFERNLPGGPGGNSFGKGRGGEFKKGQQPPANSNPSQNQNQGTQPTN